MKFIKKNEEVRYTINNIEHGNATSIEFANWEEVSDWWSANPTAIRQFPNNDEKEMTIDKHNAWNHAINFPCVMTFLFPIDKTA